MNVHQASRGSGRRVKEDGVIINEADILESQVGGKGAEFISDTVAHTTTGVFTSLQVIDDAVIGAYTTNTNASITGNTFTGILLVTGTVIFGRFKSITLTSGKVLAYKGI